MDLTYKIQYHPDVKSDLKKISKIDQKKIRSAIEDKLMKDPVRFGKPLRYSLKSCRSLRVGDYRVIYRVSESTITVLVIKIGHRRDVYQD
ncbi:MAG: type II toxin-antitoxin system RelE/ParE family toxin [Oligoflexales bacterium]|nr:type II toxin-antitoxin system RelE/ParE family toxin [Oligoflexales bacterium]